MISIMSFFMYLVDLYILICFPKGEVEEEEDDEEPPPLPPPRKRPEEQTDNVNKKKKKSESPETTKKGKNKRRLSWNVKGLFKGKKDETGKKKGILELYSLHSKRFFWVDRKSSFAIAVLLIGRTRQVQKKNWRWRRGRGMKETLANKPLSFENLCSSSNATC